MNVLITSASRKVSLVKAFQQALVEEGGGKVVAVDMSPLSVALYFADEHYLVPASHKPEFLEEILRLCESLEINLVIPTRDEELPFFSEHKEKFASVDSLVMVPDPATVRSCQDKKLFIQFCQENGFATPKTYEPEGLSIQTEFPLFVKPRHGKGGRRTIRVDSREELELALEGIPDAIVQEFVQAPEYTIDLFADFSGRVISVVPRERVRVFGGESFVGRTTSNPKLVQEAVRLARDLGLIGHNTIQCFLDNDTVKFIEVNPRFGGGANLGFAAGAPTPLFLVRLLKGETLEPKIGEFNDNLVMLRYTQDLFLDSKSLADRTFQ
ncbi:MAG TPA: ATP-grasp domain-containing protein [Anaerolineae bacterium]|nr:ATP-grasp domain-containing protein [Anaerolineae bacterium]